MAKNRSKPKEPKVSHLAADAASSALRVPKLRRMDEGGENRPVWRFTLVDHGGDWGMDSISDMDLRTIYNFLREAEKKTWKALMAETYRSKNSAGARNKHVPMEACIPEAQERLRRVLKIDDYNDSWFRFRLGNLPRLWGVLEEPVFYPVWWDRDHQVCPSRG